MAPFGAWQTWPGRWGNTERTVGGRLGNLTLHEQHYVLASRIVARADDEGSATLLIPAGRAPTAIVASSYNRLRQRSDPVTVQLSR